MAARGILYSALDDPQFGISLLNAIARRRRAKGRSGEIFGHAHAGFSRDLGQRPAASCSPAPCVASYNHSALIFGDQFLLKLFRKVEPDRNPELEVEQFLGREAGFRHTPRIAGLAGIPHRRAGAGYARHPAGPRAVSRATGWQYTMDSLGLFFDRALAATYDVSRSLCRAAFPVPLRIELAAGLVASCWATMWKWCGCWVSARRRCTWRWPAAPDDPVFAPEPFTDFYRQSLYHGMVVLSMRYV